MADANDTQLDEALAALNARVEELDAGMQQREEEHKREVAELTRQVQTHKTTSDQLSAEVQSLKGQQTTYLSQQTTRAQAVRASLQKVEGVMRKYNIPFRAVAVVLGVGLIALLALKFQHPFTLERTQVTTQTRVMPEEPPAGFLRGPVAMT